MVDKNMESERSPPWDSSLHQLCKEIDYLSIVQYTILIIICPFFDQIPFRNTFDHVDLAADSKKTFPKFFHEG